MDPWDVTAHSQANPSQSVSISGIKECCEFLNQEPYRMLLDSDTAGVSALVVIFTSFVGFDCCLRNALSIAHMITLSERIFHPNFIAVFDLSGRRVEVRNEVRHRLAHLAFYLVVAEFSSRTELFGEIRVLHRNADSSMAVSGLG